MKYLKKLLRQTIFIIEQAVTTYALKNTMIAILYRSCVHAENIVVRQCTERKIPYEEIDYIQRDNKKTIMHLTNRDREVISRGMGNVNDDINRKYFVKYCIYIQNEVALFWGFTSRTASSFRVNIKFR